MSKLKDKLYSVATSTCPQCHKGDLFINKNPYKFKDWDKMHENCSHCGLKYEMEPGYFQGAMYVSYALGVALAVSVFLVVYFFFGLSPIIFLSLETIVLIALAPIIFRLSRSIYMNFFIPFNKDL
jgi:uncharacterized protein (DUF983 family)